MLNLVQMIKLSKAQLLIIGVAVVIGGLAINSWRLSRQNKKLGIEIETLKKDPQSVAKEEIKELVGKLSKLVVLPADEEPVVATVTDKEKLKDQPVFARAENGLKIALVNGSKNTGISNELEKRIMEKNIPGVLVVSKATAKSDSYEKTLVLDITGKMSRQAAEVALLVGGQVATQSAEAFPKADLMIIVGADFK
ncbi:MAG: hypothetical protein UW42_C0024G0013 [Candidatus Collierbacteria bacterium GW2011_GWB1_44_197]|nr:MAG: hypothetical protein UW42_C0024G0013 [Candidatus Collierbacteria bacterium GW2011_GWB1_44_197]